VPATSLVGNRETLGDARLAALKRILLATEPATYAHWGSTIRHGMESATDADFDALRTFGDMDAIPHGKGR
jgi:hypothetical protein